jgi:lantibiotic modifying enzyme
VTTIADGGAPADVRAGADSVFAYLERTAEPVRAGVRWRTLSYQNTPEYAPGLWDGTAGIALFLADYERLTADGRGAHLARAALAWSTGAAPTEIDSDEGYAASLGWGWSGIGLAWLRLAAVTGRDAPRAAAAVMGERVLAAGPGPRVSLLQGAAGRGAFLVRLWAATGDGRFLAGAVACAEALRTQLLPAACGGAWPPDPTLVNGPAAGVPLGYAGGLAGVGHFFARVAAHTGDATWHKAARDIATLLAASAHPERGGINWPPALGAGPTRLPDLGHPRCQWCIGGAGIGLFYAAASELLADAKWREMAVAAGQATYAYGDGRGNPG